MRFVTRYRADPVAFVREVLLVEPDAWQADVLRAAARGDRQISVRSGHNVGKSTTASWLAIWAILCYLPVKVILTAPSAPQLFDVLFAELVTWANKLPPLLRNLVDIKSDRVELKAAPKESFITVRTARAETPEAVAGAHAVGGKVIVIGDEASGIAEQVFEAVLGSMAQDDALLLLLGNPIRSSGYFFDTHHKLKAEWTTFHVASTDCTRVSRDWVRSMALRYGEESNAYRVRVLGEFPKGDDDTVIPLELVTAAIDRDVQAGPNVPEVWGLDVARFGTDSSALCRRRGRVVPEPVQVWRNLDLMELCGRVAALYEGASTKPTEILVDSIGMGAGVVDRLRELGLPVRGINVAEAPGTKGTYLNLRAELWYAARDWLVGRDVRLPKDERLVDELTSVRYGFQSSGKIQIESKDAMKRRGLDSPDVADAFVLTFGSAAFTLSQGSRGGVSWGQPIVRALKRVL